MISMEDGQILSAEKNLILFFRVDLISVYPSFLKLV